MSTAYSLRVCSAATVQKLMPLLADVVLRVPRPRKRDRSIGCFYPIVHSQRPQEPPTLL